MACKLDESFFLLNWWIFLEGLHRCHLRIDGSSRTGSKLVAEGVCNIHPRYVRLIGFQALLKYVFTTRRARSAEGISALARSREHLQT